jgi:chromosome segregation ATPase
LTELEQKINEELIVKSRLKSQLTEMEVQISEIQGNKKELEEEKREYSTDLKRIDTHYDPSGLTIEQIQKKLFDEDPTMFRAMLKELNFTGEDPEYEKQDLYNRMT